MKKTPLSLAAALVVTLMLPGLPAMAQQAPTPTEAELAQKLDKLAAELATVKAQLQQLQQQRGTAPAPATPATASAPAAVPVAAAAAPAPAEPATVLGGYGELNYNRPTHAKENAQADVRRFVLALQHRFDGKTKMVAELEVEHAVASADDSGEVEVEQAYIEHQVNPNWAVRGGLFLVPIGLLNENHEPTSYYGVERNFVETAIIPSTWREGGLQVVGTFDNGITLQGGLSTSFDLTKWDASSTEGSESPLASVHQELQQAKAHDIAAFGALNWRGIPGLQLGGGLFTGHATQSQPGFDTARITLWDLHARWTPGRADLSALYTRGSISNTAALNAPLVGGTTLIPKSFDGWYVQGAYKVWTQDDYALSPFVRWEQFNTAKSFEDLGQGLTPSALPTERVVTVGANFQLAQGVVVKADVQRFRENTLANRVNLGLGWSF